MDIVPSLWVSTYYCILGWHLVITKNQKKKNYLLVCYFKASIAIRLLYCERCFEKFPTEFFFFLAGGLWRMTEWSLINHSSPLARPIVWHTANHGSLTHDHRRRERSCDWLSQASRVTSRCAVMEDTCYSRCLLLHFFI